MSDLKEELGLCQGLASMQSSAIKILENKIALLERKLAKCKSQRNEYIASVYDVPGINGWSDIIFKHDNELEELK